MVVTMSAGDIVLQQNVAAASYIRYTICQIAEISAQAEESRLNRSHLRKNRSRSRWQAKQISAGPNEASQEDWMQE